MKFGLWFTVLNIQKFELYRVLYLINIRRFYEAIGN